MKPFKSFLAPKLNEFLTYRETLGYSLKTIRYHLLLFDRYVMEKNADWHSFQPGFFLDMRSNIKLEKNSVNANIWAIRNFFQFLIRQDHIKKTRFKTSRSLRKTLSCLLSFLPSNQPITNGDLQKDTENQISFPEGPGLLCRRLAFGSMRHENIRTFEIAASPLSPR